MTLLILKKVLQLDSLVNFLSWKERALIHQYKDGDFVMSQKVLTALEWILQTNWNAPEMRYEDDRILYFYNPDSNEWLSDENYLKLFCEYKEDLLKLKLSK